MIAALADYWRDPHKGCLSNKIPDRLRRPLVFFCFHPSASQAVAEYFMIRNWGTLATKSLSAFSAPWSFLFSSLSFASELRAENKKSPSFAMLRKRILLRSVADSNRRTRFCRPMPSHSANRPFFRRCLSANRRTTDHFFVDAYPPTGGQPTIFSSMPIRQLADNRPFFQPMPIRQLADDRPIRVQK